MKIEYNSIPVYNYSYIANAITPSAAIWTDAVRKEAVWTCADWITFFKALKDKFGEIKAKELWGYYWSLGLSKGAGGKGDPRAGSGIAYDSVPLDCRSLNSDFVAFVQKFKLSDTVYRGLGVITKPIGFGVGLVSDVSSAVSTTGKVLEFGVPILVITGFGLLIWWGVRKVKNS